MSPHVVMLVANDLSIDTRVRKIASAVMVLSGAIFHQVIFSFGTAPE